MARNPITCIAGAALGALVAFAPAARAWDHPGHMVTAAIAFSEIERARPDLVEKLGLLFLKHPDPAPFWVAAGDAKGKERIRRMFIECARWPDDNKFTANDRLTWHSARWAVVADDASPEVVAAAEARNGKPTGQAIEALTLMSSMLSNPEADPSELAFALCWMLHILGDIHQPMHVSDLFSANFPTGNAGATMSYVHDPVTDQPIPLHILWDSNFLRIPSLGEVDRNAQAFMQAYPRSALAELSTHPLSDPDAFRDWALESNRIAADWAFNVETTADPNRDQPAEKLVQNMVNFILNGVSPVEEAPDLPTGYWEKLKETAEQRMTLAGYRIADVILSAADQIEAQRRFMGR